MQKSKIKPAVLRKNPVTPLQRGKSSNLSSQVNNAYQTIPNAFQSFSAKKYQSNVISASSPGVFKRHMSTSSKIPSSLRSLSYNRQQSFRLFSSSSKPPQHGSIELIMGPMFSGKTTELLHEYRKSKSSGFAVTLVKHAVDQRYHGETEVVTHNMDRMKAHAVHMLGDPKLQPVLDSADHIFVDEGQFFPDIDTSVEALASKGKRVVVAALDGTFKREPFPNVAKLISKADRYKKILAECHTCGADAPFSKRLTDEEDVCVIGGVDKYQAACRNCYEK